MNNKYLLSESTSRALTNRRVISEARLRSLIKTRDRRSLTESHIFERYDREIIIEAIRYERLVILEAFSNMSTDEVVEMYWYFKESIKNLLTALQAREALNQFNGIIVHGDDAMNMLTRGVDIESGYSQKIQKVFTDVVTVVRGLMSLSDNFTDRSSPVGDMWNSAMQISIRSGVSGGPLFGSTLLDTFKEIDKVKAQHTKKKGGFWGSIVKNKSKSKGVDFKDAVAKVLKSASPGFSRLIDIDNLTTSIMNLVPEKIEEPFTYFDNTITNIVDDEQLTDLLSQKGWLSRTLGDVASRTASAAKNTYNKGKETVSGGVDTLRKKLRGDDSEAGYSRGRRNYE